MSANSLRLRPFTFHNGIVMAVMLDNCNTITNRLSWGMISIRKIEAVIAGMYGLEPTKVVRARLQHLNVRDFPPGLRVGKAKRAEYGVAELYAYALWFALAEAFVPGAVAVEIVRDAWPELVRALLASAEPTAVESHPATNFVCLVPEALAATGPTTNARAAAADAWDIRIVNGTDLAPLVSGAVGGAWFLDVSGLLDRMINWLGAGPMPVAADIVRSEIGGLLLLDGWIPGPSKAESPEASPSIRHAEARVRGDRLFEADYYFARAIAILDDLGSSHATSPLSARAMRYLRYLEDPAPRERWKAWPRVTGSEIPFWWAFAALVQAHHPDAVPHLSGTLIAIATNALGDVGDTAAQISLLRSDAERYREMELHEA